jgi:hypothetical protein
MADQRIYKAVNLDVHQMASELVRWFEGQDMEAQVVDYGQGGTMIQARAKDFIKKYSVALTVTITPQGDTLLVQTGSAKWAANAVSAVAAAIIFWPLLALPAYTSLKQKELIDDTWQYIDRVMATAGSALSSGMGTPSPATPAPAAPAPAAVTCPACGETVRPGARFCEHCGTPLAAACPKCGAVVRSGAKFCDSCGTPLN